MSCFVCNNLKGGFDDHQDAPTREEKLRWARRHVMERRAEKIAEDFASWVKWKEYSE